MIVETVQLINDIMGSECKALNEFLFRFMFVNLNDNNRLVFIYENLLKFKFINTMDTTSESNSSFMPNIKGVLQDNQTYFSQQLENVYKLMYVEDKSFAAHIENNTTISDLQQQFLKDLIKLTYTACKYSLKYFSSQAYALGKLSFNKCVSIRENLLSIGDMYELFDQIFTSIVSSKSFVMEPLKFFTDNEKISQNIGFPLHDNDYKLTMEMQYPYNHIKEFFYKIKLLIFFIYYLSEISSYKNKIYEGFIFFLNSCKYNILDIFENINALIIDLITKIKISNQTRPNDYSDGDQEYMELTQVVVLKLAYIWLRYLNKFKNVNIRQQPNYQVFIDAIHSRIKTWLIPELLKQLNGTNFEILFDYEELTSLVFEVSEWSGARCFIIINPMKLTTTD